MAADHDALRSGAAEIIPADGLDAKLALGRPLRVKLGIDPSRPDLTLGHAVVLGALQRFLEAGHEAILIVGDFTGRVGDPSGRSETRPMLSADEADENAQSYLDQAGLVLDVERATVRRNSEWLAELDAADLIRLASVTTIARMLEREDFRARYEGNQPISVVEFLYPLLQGYDSVAVEADIELGGTDQTFNLLMGRGIQAAYGQTAQSVLTMPLLTGIDGVQKMSKSFGNAIGITEPPDEMYGKTLKIPDEAMPQWYDLLLGSAPPPDLSPRDAKHALARALVERFHGPEAAAAAAAGFERVHVLGELPEEIEELVISNGAVIHLPALIAEAFGGSRSDARRTIEGGGVKLDGEPVSALDLPASDLDGRVLQVGKRRFLRLRVA